MAARISGQPFRSDGTGDYAQQLGGAADLLPCTNGVIEWALQPV